MRLAVTLPTFNEKDNISEVISQIFTQSKNLPGIEVHVLVSDSHSTDGTAQVVKKISQKNPRVHYLDVKKRGLGIGLVKGHRFAVHRLQADILAQMDADLSHDPSSLPKMILAIKSGYDMVVGSRLMKGGKNLLGWHRRFFTRGSALYCKLAWGTFNFSEYTNSYRVFTKELFEKIDFSKVPWQSQSYIIQPAFLYAAIKAGAKIKEIPITFVDRKKGYSKAKIITYTLDVLKFGIKVRIRRSKTFFKFLMVGAISYLINAVVLGLLYKGQIYQITIFSKPLLFLIPQYDLSPNVLFLRLDRLFISSIISIELSIFFNFIMHDKWTFRHREKSGHHIHRFLKFNLSSSASPLIQLASILVFARVFNLNEQIGLAFGVAVGLFFNYFVNLLWIWKEPSK